MILYDLHPNAKIGKDVTISNFTTIYDDVEIGDGTWIGPNVTIFPGARIGKNCKIFPAPLSPPCRRTLSSPANTPPSR